MMSERGGGDYEAPELIEYGSVETLTGTWKYGSQDDHWGECKDLSGSSYGDDDDWWW